MYNQCFNNKNLHELQLQCMHIQVEVMNSPVINKEAG